MNAAFSSPGTLLLIAASGSTPSIGHLSCFGQSLARRKATVGLRSLKTTGSPNLRRNSSVTHHVAGRCVLPLRRESAKNSGWNIEDI